MAIRRTHRDRVWIDDFSCYNSVLGELDRPLGSSWIREDLRSIDVAIPAMRRCKKHNAAVKKPVGRNNLN